MGEIWKLVVILLTAGVVIEGVAIVAILRQVGSIILMIHPDQPREIAAGPDIGSVVDVPGRTAGMPLVAVFVSPGCPPCEEMLPGIPVVRRRYPRVDFVAVVVHEEADVRADYALKVGDFADANLFGLFGEWNVRGTPFGVALDAERRVRHRGVVNSIEQLETMAEAALAEPLAEPFSEVLEHASEQNGNGSVSVAASVDRAATAIGIDEKGT